MATDKKTNGSNIGLNLGLNIWGERSATQPTASEPPPSATPEDVEVASGRRNAGRIRISGLMLITTILVGFVIGAVVANFQKPKYMSVRPVELHEAETNPGASGADDSERAAKKTTQGSGDQKGREREAPKKKSQSKKRARGSRAAVAAAASDIGSGTGTIDRNRDAGGDRDGTRDGDGSGAGDGADDPTPTPSDEPSHGPSDQGKSNGKSEDAKGHNKTDKDDRNGS